MGSHTVAIINRLTESGEVPILNGSGLIPENLIPEGGDVSSASVTAIVSLTQAEYDGLTPDANTLYFIVG